MSRVHLHTDRKGKRHWVKTNNLDDVFDTNRFVWDKLRSLRALFGQRSEKDGKRIAKDLLCCMLGHMANDLIEKNDAFVLPKRQTGIMVITDMRKVPGLDMQKYKIDPIDDRATVYCGSVVLDRLFRKSIGDKVYLFKLVQPYIERMRELRFTKNMSWR